MQRYPEYIATSLPSRGAWIEIAKKQDRCAPLLLSLPSRGAWIEMASVYNNSKKRPVAPLTGSVDRNSASWSYACRTWVAPLTGSVDRNITLTYNEENLPRSLPSRGAWIEISRASESQRPAPGRSPHGERG